MQIYMNESELSIFQEFFNGPTFSWKGNAAQIMNLSITFTMANQKNIANNCGSDLIS